MGKRGAKWSMGKKRWHSHGYGEKGGWLNCSMGKTRVAQLEYGEDRGGIAIW